MVTTATQAVPVTPHDSNNLQDPADALWIGTAGNVSVVTLDGGTVIYKNVPVGHLMQAVKRVNATSTTAADILALYIQDI